MSQHFRLWYNAKFRRIFFQVLAVIILVGFAAFIYHNTSTNLKRLNIAPGFEFMGEIAGFMPTTKGMNLTGFDLNKSTHGDVYVVGMVNTLMVAVLGIILTTIVGFVMGILRLSNNIIISFISSAYVEGMRNIPILLWILIWYFAVLLSGPSVKKSIDIFDTIFINKRYIAVPEPWFGDGSWMLFAALIISVILIYLVNRWSKVRQDVTGEKFPVFWASLGILILLQAIALILAGFPVEWEMPRLKGFNFVGGIQVISTYMAVVLALTFYTGAYIAEIVRAGILSVSSGQIDAARAVGLSSWQIMRLVIIPQALRVIIPPLATQYMGLTKNSSLAVAVGYMDLVNAFAGVSLMQTGNALEIIMLTMLFYASVSLIISMFMNWFNRRVAIVER